MVSRTASQNTTHQPWSVRATAEGHSGSLESWFPLRHADGNVRIGHQQLKFVDPSYLVLTVQAAGGSVMWGMFSWHRKPSMVWMPQPIWVLLLTIFDQYCCSPLCHLIMATSSMSCALSQNTNPLKLVP